MMRDSVVALFQSMDSSTLSNRLQYVKLITTTHTFRRIFIFGALLISLYIGATTVSRSHPFEISIHRHGDASPNRSRYNETKVALLIENREDPILAPLMLHFISVVPPDWKFRFMGSPASVAYLNTSRAIQAHVADGKLDLTLIPANMTTGSQEEISQFLTTRWLYEVVLQPAEWLLVFQTDSMLCSNSRQSLNSWLDYDWVGAPWVPDGGGAGGNGGLSLRRVSRIIEVLRDKQRQPGDIPEDVFLCNLLNAQPGAKMANGTVSMGFSGEMHSGKKEKVTAEFQDGVLVGETEDPVKSGELIRGVDDWRDGHYEPMGYHTGNSGKMLHAHVWGNEEARKHIWKYCPEIKMILKMDAEKYVPGNCNNQWKREIGGEVFDDDDVDYPELPAGLMSW